MRTDAEFEQFLAETRADIDRLFRKWTAIQCGGIVVIGCVAAAAIRWL